MIRRPSNRHPWRRRSSGFIQRVYRIFSLLRFHRFYSKSEFWVKLSEISRKNEWKLVELSEIESNWIKNNSFLLNLTKFHSIPLIFTNYFAKFHSILLEIPISSKNDENAVNWKCGKPVVWNLRDDHTRTRTHTHTHTFCPTERLAQTLVRHSWEDEATHDSTGRVRPAGKRPASLHTHTLYARAFIAHACCMLHYRMKCICAQ